MWVHKPKKPPTLRQIRYYERKRAEAIEKYHIPYWTKMLREKIPQMPFGWRQTYYILMAEAFFINFMKMPRELDDLKYDIKMETGFDFSRRAFVVSEERFRRIRIFVHKKHDEKRKAEQKIIDEHHRASLQNKAPKGAK